jgi:hypothetical protein
MRENSAVEKSNRLITHDELRSALSGKHDFPHTLSPHRGVNLKEALHQQQRPVAVAYVSLRSDKLQAPWCAKTLGIHVQHQRLERLDNPVVRARIIAKNVNRLSAISVYAPKELLLDFVATQVAEFEHVKSLFAKAHIWPPLMSGVAPIFVAVVDNDFGMQIEIVVPVLSRLQKSLLVPLWHVMVLHIRMVGWRTLWKEIASEGATR